MTYWQDDSTKWLDELLAIRSNTRKLKQLIQILESNNNNRNTYLYDIRSVTNDGKDLEQDNNDTSLSSIEVLDRLMI